MRTYLDCIPCFLDQALRAGRIATEDEAKIKRLLDEVGMALKDIPLECSPPEAGILIYGAIREITGVFDPYLDIKIENTDTALSLYPDLKKKVRESDDPLLTAIRIAIAGNVIDFGANDNFDVEREVEDALQRDFAVFDYERFKERLDLADEILYLGDNAGEAVFDKILIEELGKPTTYVVREIPVINDATREDALRAGLDEVATIISSGTKAPGTVLKTCSTKFVEIYENSEMVISKGQGNYEALSEENHALFFLLKAKCRVIAGDLGVEEGDIVLKGAAVEK